MSDMYDSVSLRQSSKLRSSIFSVFKPQTENKEQDEEEVVEGIRKHRPRSRSSSRVQSLSVLPEVGSPGSPEEKRNMLNTRDETKSPLPRSPRSPVERSATMFNIPTLSLSPKMRNDLNSEIVEIGRLVKTLQHVLAKKSKLDSEKFSSFVSQICNHVNELPKRFGNFPEVVNNEHMLTVHAKNIIFTAAQIRQNGTGLEEFASHLAVLVKLLAEIQNHQ
jgi:hypothetical protein